MAATKTTKTASLPDISKLSAQQRNQLKANVAAEIERRLCKRDCRRFIERHVYIEDKDIPGLAIKFVLWPAQTKVLDAFLTSRLTIVLKARQLGLSWLALAYVVHKIVFFPGFTATGISKREDDAKELVRRVEFILRHLPNWMVRQKGGPEAKGFNGPVWESTTQSVTIYHPPATGADKKIPSEPSVFRVMNASPESGRSFTDNLVIMDEWAFHPWAEAIWTAAYPAINRPGGGQVIGLSTGRRGTWFEKVWLRSRQGLNTFVPIFLPWWSDPRRTPEWYEQTKRDLPNTYRAEYPATEEEAFTVGEGAFFEEWDEAVHVLREWRPPKAWKRIRAYDPGFSSFACCKWYAVSPDGWAVAYREYYPHRVTDVDQAREIRRLSVYDDGTPEEIEYTVADTDAWTPSRDSGQSTAQIFAAEGVPLRQATKDLQNGWRRLHQWLKPYTGADGERMALLRFTRECANTIRCYPACEQSKTNPEDIDRSSEHHCQDVDRYFCMSRPEPYAEKGLQFPEDMPESERAAVRKNLEFEEQYRRMQEMQRRAMGKGAGRKRR